MTVYRDDGETILASGQAAGVGYGTFMRFQADVTGVYFIKIEPLTPHLMGTDAMYGVSVVEVKEIFLPLVLR